MSLRMIYGRAGTGKSSFIFEEIAEKISSSENKQKIYLITPEQFSFTAEKRLMDSVQKIGKKAVTQAEVLTFERMAYRVMQEVGGACMTHLSSTGKAMLVYSILAKNKKKLKFLGKTDENVELVCKTITELKKHNVSEEMLQAITKQMEESYLKAKVEDIELIYEQFQAMLEGQYVDENDNLSILANQLDKTSLLENCEFYIDEFAGFTPQEYTIIEKLLKMGNRVSIAICLDTMEEESDPDKDVFYDNKLTVKKLQKLAKENEIELEQEIVFDTSYRFKKEELKFLEENLYVSPAKKFGKKVENIELFLAKNPYSEIEEVAQKINTLVRENGMRYQDIAIITKQMDVYSSLIKAIFAQYEIPIFIDEKKDLSQNLLVKYILGILEIFAQNWSYEAVFQYLKIGFLPEEIEKEEIFKLENYCLKWGIKGNKWYIKDWNYGDYEEEQKKQIERFNEIRKIVVTPLLQLKFDLQNAIDVKSMTKRLYEFLIEMQIEQKWKRQIESLENMGMLELANEYQTSWNIITEVFDEMVMLFGDKKMAFERYGELLKIGLKNSDLGKIPATQDQVIAGDTERSRSHKVKAIFIIGLNDGNFPSNNKEEGFLNDEDREFLKEKGIELAKTTIARLYEENFNIYKAFSTAEEKLYLSYVSSDSQGASLRGSVLIGKLKRLFPELQQRSDMIQSRRQITTLKTTFDQLIEVLRQRTKGEEIDEIWYAIYDYYANSPVWKDRLEKSVQGIFYTNLPEKIKKQNLDKLYGNIMKTSISRLEQYQSCPFSFYLRYALKISPQDTFQMKSMDTGSFMHDVIDEFFSLARQKQIDIKEMTDQQMQEMIENILKDKLNLNKNYIFNSTSKFKVLTNRLKKVIQISIKYIVESLKCSDFEVMGNEVEFGSGTKYPPIRIEIDNGKAIEITGKIDRMDIAKTPEGKYIRIVDYKSSVKNIDLNEVVAGLQIQLLTYLDAACKIEEMLPAGVLYFSLIDPMVKRNKRMTEEEIEIELKKKFKMNGLILADVNIVKKMDKTLEKGASTVVPAYIDKEGNLSKGKSNAITREQFEALQKYIPKIVKQIGKEILSGNIEQKPYYNVKTKKTPCEYCEYKGICQFQKGFCQNDYRYIEQNTKEEVIEKIMKQEKSK